MDLEIAKLLLEHKADPNMAWGGSDTPLIKAVKGGRNDIVKLLLAEESCDPRLAANGTTALLVATETLNYDAMDALISRFKGTL